MGLMDVQPVSHGDWLLHKRQPFTHDPVFFTANKHVCGSKCDCYVNSFKSRCAEDQIAGATISFCVGKIAAATRTHIHTNIHTHPGGLLQMVATERVVQVEADNIAVRQTKVFAHCGQSCRRRLTGPYRLLLAHVRDTAADMSMSHCVTARTGLRCVNARLALLTVRPQDCTVPLSRTIRQ